MSREMADGVLDERWLTAAVCAFSDSFAGDPILNWWQGDRDRIRRERMFRHLLTRGKACGLVIFGGPAAGMAICSKVERREGQFSAVVRAVRVIGEYRRFTSLSRIWRLLWASYVLVSMQPTGDFIHFEYLMVNGPLRGRGQGTQLINEIVAYASNRGLSIYMETGSAAVCAFFRRRGWPVVAESQLPCGGPNVWGLSFSTDVDG